MDEESKIGSEEEQEEGIGEAAPPEASFPHEILELEHSFGYDCKRLYNLVLIDDDTLVFASGNYLHYFSISRKVVTYRETVFGGGIGFITKNEHPDYEGLLTVAENCKTPTVFVYEYPSHNIRIKLEGAAKAMFTCGSYNASGELFASQAGYPDFMLTIWRWASAEIILRSKSFQSDVLHVHFSRFNPILLVSSGLSHIKFWKMANTFTGLKLQGDLGRFGKTDFSDIYAIYMLPDENVISGCEWGNILLWEAGLIKFEVCRKGRKPCHQKPITRITMENGEVTTVGMDGYVRIWFWETVDLADPPDEDRFVEIEPIYEFKIGNCEIRCMQKIKPFDLTHYGYYAEDGGGGIWYCDLNVMDIPHEPYKLYSCHGGKVLAAQVSPVSPHILTLGEDGKLAVYDYNVQKLLLERRFTSFATDLLWLNAVISSSGMEIVVGFQDGVIRHLLLDLNKLRLRLVHATKGHTAAVTALSMEPTGKLLVTGAADQSIFIYTTTEKTKADLVKFAPMGFVVLGSVPNAMNWHRNDDAEPSILIGSKSGDVYEYKVPTFVSEEDTFLSYNITQPERLKSTKFVSVKSRIRRDLKRAQTKKRKAMKRKRKLEEVERLKAANPGLQIDMESALADSEPDEEEEPMHIPAKPNPVLWLRYTKNNTIWCSMGGYDAGYIYELSFGAPEPVRCTLIHDGDDCEIRSYLTICDFLLFGMYNGKVRINHINPDDFTDLRDYRLHNMHDALCGVIPRLLLSYNSEHIFSIGYDGNIFVYKWNGPKVERDVVIQGPKPVIDLKAEDIVDPEHPSLEQEKIYAEIKRQEEAAAAHDREVLMHIGELQVKFNEILRDNSTLPEAIVIPDKDMLLDPRITTQIKDELQAELDDVREDLAYDLEFAEVGKNKLYNYFLKELDHIPITIAGIGINSKVDSFRLEKLGDEYLKMKEEIEERLRLEAANWGMAQPVLAEEKEDSMPEPPIEKFFFGRDPNTIIPRFSRKLLRLLNRYRARQLYDIERIYNWDKLERQKPDPNKNHPDDDRNIREAERSMGDYKLKISADYEPERDDNLTHKYIELVSCREKLFEIMKSFNDKVFELRDKKKDVYEFINSNRKRLNFLHQLIPEKNRIYLMNIPEINMEDEYPELNLIQHYTPGCGVEIDDILYLEKTVAELIPETAPEPTPVNTVPSREMEEYEIFMNLRVNELEHLPEHEELMNHIENIVSSLDPSYNASPGDNKPSPWLMEFRYHVLMELIEEQKCLIFAVEDRVRKFDDELTALSTIRFTTKFDVDFMQSYMIVLNQEMNILRDSEEIENQLLKNADEAMKTRNQMQSIINTSNRQIEESRKSVDKLNEAIASVQWKFMSTCKGHRFFDFLRRIFKKKWKQPKPPKGPDESSESSSDDDSSSEDEEEDTKSVDSTDMTAIRLDETHCPPGLERTMYDLAFKMRSERHALEKALMEQHKIIEIRRVEVNELQKQMKFHEAVYDQEKATLLAFRRKRQQELNKVKVSIVLRMHQMQHFYEGEDYRDLSKALLFDATRLSNLNDRVEQLKAETVETQRLYRINIVHLRRMNKDLKFMRFEIMRLEENIKDMMMKKFGMIVNLDDLEEEVLRKYVFELETTAEEELRQIDREIQQKKLELQRVQVELTRETDHSTEKLNILTVLNEEKNYLLDILEWQDKNYERWFKPKRLDFDRDIERLLVIDKRQKEKIECLEREICTLRLKAKPLQIDPEPGSTDETKDVLQQADIDGCPEMLASDAYDLRTPPDSYIMVRIEKIVSKVFSQRFGAHMPKKYVLKYTHKVARYLGQAGNSFEGQVTERILDCIVENIQMFIPKKYLIYLSDSDLRKLFNDVLAVFDYERSEVQSSEVITGIYECAVELVNEISSVLNKTQYILEHMFKELIEVLPLKEFLSDDTLNVIVNLMAEDEVIDPRCVSIERLIENTINHAKTHMLDDITAIPMRRLSENIVSRLMSSKRLTMNTQCSLSSVASVTIIKRSSNH